MRMLKRERWWQWRRDVVGRWEVYLNKHNILAGTWKAEGRVRSRKMDGKSFLEDQQRPGHTAPFLVVPAGPLADSHSALMQACRFWLLHISLDLSSNPGAFPPPDAPLAACLCWPQFYGFYGVPLPLGWLYTHFSKMLHHSFKVSWLFPIAFQYKRPNGQDLVLTLVWAPVPSPSPSLIERQCAWSGRRCSSPLGAFVFMPLSPGPWCPLLGHPPPSPWFLTLDIFNLSFKMLLSGHLFINITSLCTLQL